MFCLHPKSSSPHFPVVHLCDRSSPGPGAGMGRAGVKKQDFLLLGYKGECNVAFTVSCVVFCSILSKVILFSLHL